MTHLIIRANFFGEKNQISDSKLPSKEKKMTHPEEKKLIATFIISGNDNFIEFNKENTAADKTMVIAQPIRS